VAAGPPPGAPMLRGFMDWARRCYESAANMDRLGSHPNIYGMIEGHRRAKRLHKRALASSGKTPGDRIEGGSHLWHLGLTR
jgi:hypothetical protein